MQKVGELKILKCQVGRSNGTNYVLNADIKIRSSFEGMYLGKDAKIMHGKRLATVHNLVVPWLLWHS